MNEARLYFLAKLNSYNGSDQIDSLENAVLFFQSLQLKNCTHNLKSMPAQPEVVAEICADSSDNRISWNAN